MSEAEKEARRLVYLYSTILIDFPYDDSQDGLCIGTNCMTFNSAKQCALIAVDEKIESITAIINKCNNSDEHFGIKLDCAFKIAELKLVKVEIEKL